MNKIKKNLGLILILIVLSLSLVSCMPKIATDKNIIGIVDDGLTHSDYPDYKGYIYGNEAEKYNLMFRLSLPNNYDEKDLNTKYPLVIYLHWLGAQGVTNEYQLANSFVNGLKESGNECIVFAPLLPSKNMAFSPNFYNNKDMSSLYNSALDAVIEKYSIDTNRIYLTGVSMGAHNTWELLNTSPNKYAAAMPVSYGGRVEIAENVKNIPILAAHSKDDEAVDFSTSQLIVDRLKEIGGNITFKAYDSGGHGTHNTFYSEKETWDWLFSQSKV